MAMSETDPTLRLGEARRKMNTNPQNSFWVLDIQPASPPPPAHIGVAIFETSGT